MREGYDVKVEGGACALKRTESVIFTDNLGWISAAVCPGGGDLEFCLPDSAKARKQAASGQPEQRAGAAGQRSNAAGRQEKGKAEDPLT